MNFAPSILSSSLRALFSLVAVIGLIYFFMHFLLKISPTQNRISSRKNGMVEIMGKINLSPKKAIYFIKIGKKILIVGVNGGISLLSVIEDEETMKLLEAESESSKFGGFSRVLKNVFSSGKINTAFFSRVKEIQGKQ